MLVPRQPIPADAAQPGDPPSSPERALEELAGPVGADLNDRNTDGVHQRHEEIVHFFGTTGACLVEVLNLVDDQHSERVQIGHLAHGCQQTFGTQLLASVATAVVGTQDLVYFVEEAQAQLIQVTVNWAVDLQIDQLSDVVIRVMEGLGVHAQNPLQRARLAATGAAEQRQAVGRRGDTLVHRRIQILLLDTAIAILQVRIPGTAGRIPTDVALTNHQTDLALQLQVMAQRLEEAVQQAGDGMSPEPTIQKRLLRLETGKLLQ